MKTSWSLALRAIWRVLLLPSLVIVAVLVVIIRFYHAWISPLFSPSCRFTPTCSEYMDISLRKYGLIRGLLKGTWRILRCNPMSEGGHDPP